MSTTSAPYGLLPMYHPSGLGKYSVGTIGSTYGTNIFKNSPVLMNTDGTLNAVGANNVDFLGSFGGVEYNDSSSGMFIQRTSWPASTTATNIVAYFYDDPFVEYAIQADGSVAATAVEDQVNFSNFTAGSTTTGLSAVTASATPVGNGSQGQLRVLGKILEPDNDWGDAYTQLRVQVARSQNVSNKVAI